MTGTPSSLHGQHVLILGLGTSGLAMARWCTREGARVTVADTRAEPPQLAALQHELPAARFVHGPFSAALIEGSDVKAVYVSPGLTPLECAPAVRWRVPHPTPVRIRVGSSPDWHRPP